MVMKKFYGFIFLDLKFWDVNFYNGDQKLPKKNDIFGKFKNISVVKNQWVNLMVAQLC